MTHALKTGSTRIELLSACCPEAQADGVPCTALGRDCDTCARAVTAPASAAPASQVVPVATTDREPSPVRVPARVATREAEPELQDDSWAV